MEVRVGCCGWCVRGGKKAYYGVFETVEVQETFYKLPRPETVERWVESAPKGFDFNMKAWQVITHPPASPTWRKAGLKIPESRKDRYGFLKPTEENYEAWEKTLKICRAMRARVCVFQTPASFKFSRENMKNLEEFFTTISRDGVSIGWEPRGTWREHPGEVSKLCGRLDLIHVVDPFKWEPLSAHEITYLRLHGIGKGEVNYRYRYSDQDLLKLRGFVKKRLEENGGVVYVMFNNVWMMEDARRFKEILSG